jgi:hypothetical protein
MVVMEQAEVMTDAPVERRTRRWIPWAVGGGVFALTLLLGGVLVADWAWRNAEMQALLERVEASEAVMGELQESAEEAFEEHAAGGDRGKLDSELRELAKAAAVDIAAAGLEVAALPIAVWHADIERARDAYLLHNRAWVEYMSRASESSAEFIAPQPLVNQTFIDAEPIFIQAIPAPDVRDFAARIFAIFAIPEELSSDQVAA